MKRASMLVVWLCLAGCGVFATSGTPCRKHEDCTGLKDGYCSRVEMCTKDCTMGEACPEKSVCSVQGRRSVCLPTCEAKTDCIPGFLCTDGVCQVDKPLDAPAN